MDDEGEKGPGGPAFIDERGPIGPPLQVQVSSREQGTRREREQGRSAAGRSADGQGVLVCMTVPLISYDSDRSFAVVMYES